MQVPFDWAGCPSSSQSQTRPHTSSPTRAGRTENVPHDQQDVPAELGYTPPLPSPPLTPQQTRFSLRSRVALDPQVDPNGTPGSVHPTSSQTHGDSSQGYWSGSSFDSSWSHEDGAMTDSFLVEVDCGNGGGVIRRRGLTDSFVSAFFGKHQRRVSSNNGQEENQARGSLSPTHHPPTRRRQNTNTDIEMQLIRTTMTVQDEETRARERLMEEEASYWRMLQGLYTAANQAVQRTPTENLFHDEAITRNTLAQAALAEQARLFTQEAGQRREILTRELNIRHAYAALACF